MNHVQQSNYSSSLPWPVVIVVPSGRDERRQKGPAIVIAATSSKPLIALATRFAAEDAISGRPLFVCQISTACAIVCDSDHFRPHELRTSVLHLSATHFASENWHAIRFKSGKSPGRPPVCGELPRMMRQLLFFRCCIMRQRDTGCTLKLSARVAAVR